METEVKYRTNLQEAIKYFADPDDALAFFVELRWPGGIFCPRCAHTEVSFLSTRRVWKCKARKKQFSVKLGTVLEDSPLKLETWAAGYWLVVNAKNGISSHEVARSLGITQKSAWFLTHRIRYSLQTGTFEKLVGTVEADETYIGGKERNKHKDKRLGVGGGTRGKMVVMGLLERHGEVRTKHVPNNRKMTVQAEIRANVERGSEVFTDTLRSYNGLEPEYIHETINHLEEWVRGKVSTNGLENYWSLFKRCFGGTWTHLSAEHLHRYLVEQEYRFNNRDDKDGGRFAMAVAMAPGKRLTWETLITGGLQNVAPKE